MCHHVLCFRCSKDTTARGIVTANRKLIHATAPLASPASSSIEVYTDAASEVAAAGFWKSNGKWFIYTWDPKIIKENPGIAWMEFFAIVLSARLWGSQWGNRAVCIKTDSQSSVDAWNHGHFHSPNIEVLRKKLQQTSNQHGFSLAVSYIHGADNPADAISRDKLGTFLLENPTADKSATQIPRRLIEDLFP